MRRREFIAGIGSATAWPLIAKAQQAPVPVIGFLNPTSATAWSPYLVAAFRDGLREAGYVEGQNTSIEYRWAEDRLDQLPKLAADLVRRRVNVIVANGAALRAVRDATTSIPIVFYSGADPVKTGLVASLNRPGGNMTGVTNFNRELLPKRLEIMHELLPATTIGVMVNPGSADQMSDMQAAANALGLKLQIVHAGSERDFDSAFAKLSDLHAGALVIANDVFLVSRSRELGALTVHYSMPAICQAREFVTAGGLMSYGPSDTDAWHQIGLYTGRILKGDKPADLPVQQAIKVGLTINLKTAKALGLTVPQSLLVAADEVIE